MRADLIPRLLLVAALAAPLCGCMRGWLYTNVRTPAVSDIEAAPRGTRMVELTALQFKEPVSGAGMTVQWDSRAIGDAARQHGLDRVYFADLHTLSILGGLWKKQTIEVWGD